LPIGAFAVDYNTEIFVSTNSTTGVRAYCTLSTADNSESSIEWTRNSNINAGSANLAVIDAVSNSGYIKSLTKHKRYLNIRVTSLSVGTVGLGNGSLNIINAIPCYL